MKILSVFLKIFSFFSHFLPIYIIYLAFQPIARWYLSKVPVLGVDLYYTVSYVAVQLKHLSTSFNGFKDIWFAGNPLFSDIFLLHFYLMVPFAKYFGLIDGVKIYTIYSLLAFVVFSHLLFYRLSKNIILALVLSVLVLLSPSIYGAAIWGGSLPYFATQMFLPLTLFFIVNFTKTANRRWFYLSILSTAAAISGHPMPTVTYIIPSAILLILLWQESTFNFKLTSRIKDVFIFVIIASLISFKTFYRPFLNTLASLIHGNFLGPFSLISSGTSTASSNSTSQLAIDIANFYKKQATLLFTDTRQELFLLLALSAGLFFISAIIFKSRRTRIFKVLPFAFFALYILVQVYANAYGHNFLSQGWYRQFWAFPVAIGALISVLWGEVVEGFELLLSKFDRYWQKVIIYLIPLVLTSPLVIFTSNIYRTNIEKTLTILDSKAEYSSAFPEVLSIKIDKKSLNELKNQLIPTFLNPNDKNKRLYEPEAPFNIWWNSLYDMPLARGYIDPPIATSQRGGIFWLDIAISNDSLVRDFKASEDVAFNNALFLIDWNAIYYYEGGRLSSKGPNPPPSSYLLKRNVFDKEEEVKTYGLILKWQTSSGKPELRMDLPQFLKYFKVRDDLTSPVLYPSNAPVIVYFGDRASYEDFLRILGSFNINSRKLIPVYGGKFIDDFNLKSLSNFDAVFISSYDYHNKNNTFNNLLKYVKNGGKVYIDTGAEVKESNSDDLPEIFPFKESIREGLGKEWDLQFSSSPILDKVDKSKFGPLIFNGDEWKVSTPKINDLRGGSHIIFTHKGNPVFIERKIEKGEVIWSGFNAIYHYNQYKSDDEAKLFGNVLESFIKIQDWGVLPAKATWKNPENVQIETESKPRGILFKEEAYDGWSAKLVSESKSLPIYITGPSYPGFMYVPLNNLKKPYVSVRFNFNGDFSSKLFSIITVLLVVYLLDAIVLSGYLVAHVVTHFSFKAIRKLAFWWNKEDE